MVFNSYNFILIFLPFTLFFYFLFNKYKEYEIAKLFLFIMSLFFYAFNNINYLFLILISIVINYFVSSKLLVSKSSINSKIYLIIGVLFNIAILVYFKYYDFFIDNLNNIFLLNFEMLNLILPLGISFFTFQQLSYIIDSYYKRLKKYNLLDYSLFVTFFPQLVAGPIVLHSEIIPQFENIEKKKINYEYIYKGLYIFSIGLFKKVLLADMFGRVVDTGYSEITSYGTISVIFIMVCYTLQIYLDFSGYCDMATGIAKLFNIDLPKNFDSPYKAKTIEEFWKRWHMTLTRFFTTYLYIPLGGNRCGKKRTYINYFIVFLVSGLWHGANWTFIVWGILHGLAIIINKAFKGLFEKINPIINWILTFIFINITWVLFRANSIDDALTFIGQMFNFNGFIIDTRLLEPFNIVETSILNRVIFSNIIGYQEFLTMIAIICLVISLYVIVKRENTVNKLKTLNPSLINSLQTIFLLIWVILSLSNISIFLYFNF